MRRDDTRLKESPLGLEPAFVLVRSPGKEQGRNAIVAKVMENWFFTGQRAWSSLFLALLAALTASSSAFLGATLDAGVAVLRAPAGVELIELSQPTIFTWCEMGIASQ
jgi:hypothetical protein